jgi:O-antigen ligase
LLTNRLRSIRITHISLALVGLMWVVPFLHDRHEYPLTTFDQEWWTVVLGLLAMFTLLGKDYWQSPVVPRIVQFPVVLIVIALLQMALGKIAYFEQGLLYILYLLFAALLMLLGSWLRRSLGIEKLACTLAMFLLLGAELSAAIGVLQHFGWSTWFDPVVVRKISFSLYGNVAQPNHYADYIALGLVSLGLLYQQQKLKVGYVALLALPLLFVLTLSGSRSSWLYLLLSAGLAGWAWYKNRSLRPVLQYTLAVIFGFMLMHLLVQLPMLAGADAATSTMRLSDTSSMIRLYLWREAGMMFMQSPWLGVGFGQFAIHHLELEPILQPDNILGLYNNAHNVIFQLAAETGLAGVSALFASCVAWLYGLRRVKVLTAAHWWGYAAVGVLAIHSLLEYPMWYAYFIAILAVLLGMLDETEYRLEMRTIGRVSLALILLLGLTTMLQLQIAYSQLKSTLSIQATSGVSQVNSQRTLDDLLALRGSSLLTPYAELYISSFTEVSPQNIDKKLRFNGQVMHFIPTAEVVYRQAYLLAQDGQLASAKKVLEQAIWSYPGNGGAHQLLLALVEKDPAHFSALLEFATQKEQEHARAVRNK